VLRTTRQEQSHCVLNFKPKERKIDVRLGIAVNKAPGVRAALITDVFSAHQGVEDDDMNVMCLGGRVTGYELALDLIRTFLSARFQGAERFRRRLQKVAELEKSE
jgi:ribose 5-phosphate isomerase B